MKILFSDELYVFTTTFSPRSNVELNSIFSDVLLAVHPASVGPVRAPVPPYTTLNPAVPRRNPTGFLFRGWIPPMMVAVPAAAAQALSQISGWPPVPATHVADERFAVYCPAAQQSQLGPTECFVGARHGPAAGPHGSCRSPACARNEFGMSAFGSTPWPAVCAWRIAPMFGPPSVPLDARVTSPNGLQAQAQAKL